MFDKLKLWVRKVTTPVKEPIAPTQKEGRYIPSTHLPEPLTSPAKTWEMMTKRTIQRTAALDTVETFKGVAMDSANFATPFSQSSTVIPQNLIQWYGLQSFIGIQMPAIFAQHWLIDKCCTMPAEDAISKGYKTTVNDGTEVDIEILDEIRRLDVEYRINENMVDLVRKCFIFGIRIAIFKVESDDPDYYLKPFNIDGVIPGSYKGISQVDPYWITPELDAEASMDPSSIHFYEPTWWRVNGQRYHRTHLIIIRTGDLPDVLKPTYFYGGIPLPQKLYERVYCAERTANEAPQLALTKRTKVIYTDVNKVLLNQADFEKRMRAQAYYQDNYASHILDTEEKTEQFDTNLADLDEVIIGQYQIVAMIAEVPATKLLSTSPKGFNTTGEFEDTSYNQRLQSIQTHKLTPFLERHHMLLIKSHISPEFGITPFKTTIVWEPLVAPSVAELATVNLNKAQADAVLLQVGAIDGEDIRNRLITDPTSGYTGIEDESIDADPNSAPLATIKISDPETGGDPDNLRTI